MSLRKVSLWLSACLLLCSVVTVDVYGEDDDDDELSVEIVRLDCFDGESINEALEEEEDADEVIIEIDGICVEYVVVRRDRVTLKGFNNDPMMDGIQAATTDPADDPRGCALTVRDARLVFIENLTLREGVWCGLRVLNSRGSRGEIRAVNLIIEDNGVLGLELRDASMRVIDTEITELATDGIRVETGSFVRCENCTVDVTGVALRVDVNSSATVLDSALMGGTGVRAQRSSTVQLRDTTVTATDGQRDAILVRDTSAIFMTRGTIDGPIRVSDKSELSLRGVEQIDQGDRGNRVGDDSYLMARWDSFRVSSPIVTELLDTRFRALSRGLVANGSSVTDLSCGSGADVFCDSSSPVDPSSCALCPVAVCQNGIQEPGETCDNGNSVNGDGCSETCGVETVCGDGIREFGEQCDINDGIEVGQLCSASCTITPLCSNGFRETDEECDDGNTENLDDCSNSCTRNRCGDGILQPLRGEQCDDGNPFNGDSCSPFCTINN